MTMDIHYPLELSRHIDHPDFELWIGSVADYDKMEKLHPTVYVELTDGGLDLLPAVPVRIEFPQDFAGLASAVPERIIVAWAAKGERPALPTVWFDRFVRQVIATGHHTICVVAGGDCLPRLKWFAKETQTAVNRLAIHRSPGQVSTRQPTGTTADVGIDWYLTPPLA